MIAKNLAIACCAALMAFGLAACGGGTTEGTDGGTSTTPDTGGTSIPPDASVPPDPCHGTCTPDQICDSALAVPACVSVCNNGNGCLMDTKGAPVEICNPTTKSCEPMSCGGAQCATGQVCTSVSGQTFANDPNGQCTCHPALSGLGDTCAPFGKTCKIPKDATYQNLKFPWTCELPGEYETCTTSVGCADASLECIKYSQQGDMACFKKCTASTDCNGLSDFCITAAGFYVSNHCVPNTCGEDDKGNEAPSQYFAPCNATDPLQVDMTDPQKPRIYTKPGTDGTCIPFESNGKTYPRCVKGGTAAAAAVCDPDATRADATKACPVSSYCVGTQPNGTDPTKTDGICQPICNAAPKLGFATCTQDTECSATCVTVPGSTQKACKNILKVCSGDADCVVKCDLCVLDATANKKLCTNSGNDCASDADCARTCDGSGKTCAADTDCASTCDTGKGRCSNVAYGPNAACPNGTDQCVPVESSDSVMVRVGACFGGCDPVAGTGCTGPDALGNTLSCQVATFAGEGVCFAQQPTAGAVDAACATATAQNDTRTDCQTGLSCSDTTKKCTKNCSTVTCPDPAVACSDCQNNLKCVPAGTGAKIGTCE